MSDQIVLQKGEFYVFDAQEDEDFEQIYFSSHDHLVEHIRWWLNNRHDGFAVYQKRIEK